MPRLYSVEVVPSLQCQENDPKHVTDVSQQIPTNKPKIHPRTNRRYTPSGASHQGRDAGGQAAHTKTSQRGSDEGRGQRGSDSEGRGQRGQLDLWGVMELERGQWRRNLGHIVDLLLDFAPST